MAMMKLLLLRSTASSSSSSSSRPWQLCGAASRSSYACRSDPVSATPSSPVLRVSPPSSACSPWESFGCAMPSSAVFRVSSSSACSSWELFRSALPSSTVFRVSSSSACSSWELFRSAKPSSSPHRVSPPSSACSPSGLFGSAVPSSPVCRVSSSSACSPSGLFGSAMPPSPVFRVSSLSACSPWELLRSALPSSPLRRVSPSSGYSPSELFRSSCLFGESGAGAARTRSLSFLSHLVCVAPFSSLSSSPRGVHLSAVRSSVADLRFGSMPQQQQLPADFLAMRQQRRSVSKMKKYKIKPYSSYSERFRLMADGSFKRWRSGKRHNAHSKTSKQRRQLRRPSIAPPALAKVMKKLNFVR